jgi:hypothetical protein
MIRYKKYKIIGFCLAVLMLVSSCAKDDETQTTAPGSDRDKFLGTWACAEKVSGGPTTVFSISIETQGAEDTIYIYNFNNLGTPFFAVGVVSGNSLVIPSQSITQVAIAGTGIYSQGEIFMNYTADSDTLTATCSK